MRLCALQARNKEQGVRNPETEWCSELLIWTCQSCADVGRVVRNGDGAVFRAEHVNPVQMWWAHLVSHHQHDRCGGVDMQNLTGQGNSPNLTYHLRV